MRKEILWVLVFLFLLFGGVLVFEFFRGISGNAILDDYVYTRAICNGESCRDYEVVCDGDEFVEVREVVSGLVVLDEGWEDFREDEVC